MDVLAFECLYLTLTDILSKWIAAWRRQKDGEIIHLMMLSSVSCNKLLRQTVDDIVKRIENTLRHLLVCLLLRWFAQLGALV